MQMQDAHEPGYYSNYQPEAGPPLVLQVWSAVLRFRWLVLGIVGTAFLLGLIFTLLATPLYTASTRIDITPGEDRVTNVESVDDQDALLAQEYYRTQYALLESRALAERVVNELDLLNDAFVRENLLGLDEDSTVPAAKGGQSRQAVTEYLLENISIVPITGSALVDINFTSPDRAFSAKIANAWARQFIQSNIDRRYSSTADARTFLEGQLDELRDRLEESERNLVTYANENGIVPLAQEGSEDGRVSSQTLAQTQIEALTSALSNATADRIAAESAARYGGGLAGRESVGQLSDLRSKRGEAAAQYAAMMTRFGPEYPPAQDLRAELAALDRAIEREEASLLSSQRSAGNAVDIAAYRAASAREQQLRAQVNDLIGEVASERQSSIQYNIYQREVDTNRELYNGLLQRYKEIGVAGVGSTNIAIVDQADIPNAPSSPNLFANLFVSLLVGVGLAGAAVATLVQIDQTIKTAEDAKREFGLPVLGVVPHVDRETLIDDLTDPKTPVSEAYQSLSSQLGFLTDHGIPRSMAFTSSRAAEGKSASAHALALMLARQGKRVALIDADMRSPSVSDQFDLPNDRGLSDYLTGGADWRSLIVKGSDGRPDVLLTGAEPPNSPELLVGDRFKQLIRDAEQVYDHVLIDSPPVLGLADAPLIASAVEGVMFAVEANGVKINGIRRCLERLEMSQANIFGLVVTKVRTGLGGRYGYGYGYGYGGGSDGFEYGKSANR